MPTGGMHPSPTPMPSPMPPVTGNLMKCKSLQDREVTPQECEAATPVCGPNQTSTMENPCKQYSGTTFFCPTLNRQATSAECGSAMPFCRSGQTPEKDHCQSTSMMPPRPPLEVTTDQEQFKDVVKDVKTYLKEVDIGEDKAYEIRTLKLEAVVKDKNNPQECAMSAGKHPPSATRPAECDLLAAEMQIREISLSSGVSCDAAEAVTFIINEVKPDLEFIRGLNEKSSTLEQAKEGRAKLERIREVLQQLNGIWDIETETSVPGLLQSLNTCRELGYLTRDAERMLENFKHLSNTDEYRQLTAFAGNPLAFLPAGVDVSAPWSPDPEVCFADFEGPGPRPRGDKKFEPKDFGRNAVLNAGDDEFDEGFDDSHAMPPGDRCGFFEPPEEFRPKEACMPPVMRYLGMPYGVMRDLMKALAEKGCASEGEAKGDFACEGFKRAPEEIEKHSKDFSEEALMMIEQFIIDGTNACEAGDNETAAKIMRAMMKTIMPLMKSKGPPRDFVDAKAQAIQQLKDRGVIGEDEDAKRLALLEKEISSIKDQIAIMDATFQNLLVEKVSLEEKFGKFKSTFQKNTNLVTEQIARLQGDDATEGLARRISEVNEKHMNIMNSILAALPKGAEAAKPLLGEALGATFRGLSSAGNQVVDEALDAFYAKLTSGELTKEEIVEAAKTLRDQFVALADSESGAARKEGVIAFKDTPNDSWVASFAHIAVANNLASRDNENVGVGNNEMYVQAIIRAVRLAAQASPEKVGKPLEKYLGLSEEERNKLPVEKELPGLDKVAWARPFVKVCQELAVKECLALPVASLTAPVTRSQMAGLLVHLLEAAGVDLPSAASGVKPSDLGNDPNAEEILVVKAMGVMAGCKGSDDPNFCGSQNMNVGMDLVAAVNCSNWLSSRPASEE